MKDGMPRADGETPGAMNAPEAAPGPEPFWRRKRLDEMNPAEWESLCDGCARCCLVKLEDEDTGQIHYTDLGCRLLDARGCTCRDYARRSKRVPDCVTLTVEAVRTLGWLPPTCAYRLIEEGRELPDWHPLVTGDRDSVHRAGISVRGRVHALEDDLPVRAWPGRIAGWPNRWPKRGRAKGNGADKTGSTAESGEAG